ncbi:MAG: nucleotidyltransferase substrate binding protein [Desulfuromonas sp.]|nr:nucleotidyltransferase substrate binding protein [Desulfuromonas sp.]
MADKFLIEGDGRVERMHVRWKQRFQNYEKAFLRLKEAIDMEGLNELERNGLIQRFKFTLDLSWKVLKDFLEEKGFVFKPSPKDTLRMAQQGEYISYAQELIDGLEIRNTLSHDYSGEKFERLEGVLREETFVALEKLYHFFVSENQQ